MTDAQHKLPVSSEDHTAGGSAGDASAVAGPAVSLAVPCYNEETVLRSTVLRLVEAFAERGIRVELVLVDNGSRDATGRVIDDLVAAGLPVVKRTVVVNQGYGNGVLCGLAACRAPMIGLVHADGQCDPRDVVRVCETALAAEGPVLVKVRRRFRMDGLRRKIISIFYNGFINVLFPGLGSLDINGSPKVFPRDIYRRMQLRSRDWFIDPEMMLKARDMGVRVVEFNVFAQMRTGGKSHVNTSTCLEFVVNLLKYRLGMWRPPEAREYEMADACAHEAARDERVAVKSGS